MLNAILRAMRSVRSNVSGAAAMMAALSLPVLIGCGGLAVDTAQWFLWKRELQHSVDQAAIGAAWALSNDIMKGQYETRGRQEFNANLAVTKDFAEQPSFALANYAGGTDNSVIVSARARKKLPFSSVIMGRPVTINVRAQASFQEGGSYNACLIALTDESNALDIGGNANVNARCGLAALSCEDDAVVIDGSATVVTDSIATCGTANVPEENEGVVTQGVKGLKDAYADLTPPNNPNAQEYKCQGKGNNKLASLSPGTYSGGIVVKCNTVLSSGIYVIDGGELDLAANYNVIGTSVMFVLKNGARIKFGGNGNGNKITLTPMVESDFYGTPYQDQAQNYAGMLVFEDRNNNPPNPGHLLNGNSKSLIEGLIYLPSGEMTVLGTADVAAQCLQISAWKIKISGNANLETLCPIEDTTSVGSANADVRLIA